MRRLVAAAAVLLLVITGSRSAANSEVEPATAEDPTEAEVSCGSVSCEVLEGSVTDVDAARGHLVVAVDLAWSSELRTDLGETRFTLSDATLFLPTQSGLHSLTPGEDVLVRSSPDTPQGRHALAVVRVDRD